MIKGVVGQKVGEPGQSSQQRLGRTAWGHQSSARDAAAGREHSGEILDEDKRLD